MFTDLKNELKRIENDLKNELKRVETELKNDMVEVKNAVELWKVIFFSFPHNIVLLL